MTSTVGWEKAILKVFESNGGVVSLKQLYEEAPRLIRQTSSVDIKHTIRAYLRRLKRTKGAIKQIGLSSYALIQVSYPRTFYEEVAGQILEASELRKVPKQEMHGYIEGMLVELGNFNNYDTYTADGRVIFNGKRLEELVTYRTIPGFTYLSILEKAKRVDVIWFRDNFPVKTFDVENSTDFTKALVRAYQLKHFRTQFFMVANDDKKSIYDNRINAKPFDAIKDSVKFVPYLKIYDLYKNAVVTNQKIRDSAIFMGDV